MEGAFSVTEVIDLGIEIEKNGRDFYLLLAGKTKDLLTQDMYKTLAREEERHIKVFQKIKKGIEKTKNHKPSGLYTDEYYAYLNALASEYVFTQKDKMRVLAGKISSDRQALDLGIDFEKESIVFYEGIKKIVLVSARGALDKLIGEEQVHLMKLLKIKGALRNE